MTNRRIVLHLRYVYLPTNMVSKINPLPPIIREYVITNLGNNQTLVLHDHTRFI